jgi:hypothetical protein
MQGSPLIRPLIKGQWRARNSADLPKGSSCEGSGSSSSRFSRDPKRRRRPEVPELHRSRRERPTIGHGLDYGGHPRPVGEAHRRDGRERRARAGGGEGARAQGREGRDGLARPNQGRGRAPRFWPRSPVCRSSRCRSISRRSPPCVKRPLASSRRTRASTSSSTTPASWRPSTTGRRTGSRCSSG